MSFMTKFTFPQFKNCHLVWLMSVFLVQWNAGRLETIFHDNASESNIKFNKYYARKFSKNTGIEIQR